ncbi:MAG: hypothetical protein MRY21_01730 [Simkaniaceae bacterium]|nr:hypothetical protein [Simkaniaceae bacterium]
MDILKLGPAGSPSEKAYIASLRQEAKALPPADPFKSVVSLSRAEFSGPEEAYVIALALRHFTKEVFQKPENRYRTYNTLVQAAGRFAPYTKASKVYAHTIDGAFKILYKTSALFRGTHTVHASTVPKAKPVVVRRHEPTLHQLFLARKPLATIAE